jgi:hypothetical protein
LTIAGGVDQLLRLINIKTISSTQVTLYVPIIVTAIVALIVFYDYYMGAPEDVMDIYQINLLLITPEILSFSKLDWLNLIQRPQILEPTRNSLPVYLSGTIILLGYLALHFNSKSRYNILSLRNRGVDEEQLKVLYENQSQLNVGLTFLSAFVSLVIYLFSNPFSILITSFVGNVSFSYLLFGLPGILLLLATIWVFLKIEERKI